LGNSPFCTLYINGIRFKNKNGTIGKTELAALSIALNNPLSPAELSDLFKQFDKDNSSQISWDEFICYWNTCLIL